MREIASVDEFKTLIGQEVAVSDWIGIAQERIALFADATGDHQWIHLDVERARKESPYGTTIAHGFLTLSLLPMLLEQSVKVTIAKMAVNYGLNKVRFTAPVPAGSKVRARMSLLELMDIGNGVQSIWTVTFEREGSDRPVCVAEPIVRHYW